MASYKKKTFSHLKKNAQARFDVIKSNISYNNNLKNKVSSYTKHMEVKFGLPSSSYNKYFRSNMNLARNDSNFRKWLLKEY